MTRLVRSVYFECLHRYENPKWSAEENQKVFGACYTPHGHGHTYKMEVCVSGPIDPVTGMVINLKELDEEINKVIAGVAGKHLNFEVAEFRDSVPTTENLLNYLYERLKLQFKDKVYLEKVRLYENTDLWVDQFEAAT